MNYHNITKEDMLNGDGIRVVLWVSGCSHKCKGCHNQITWDKDGGLFFDKKAENELFEALDKPFIEGITFSGGDPLMIENREKVMELVKKCRQDYPNKTIWLYTGFSFDEIKNVNGIELIDVICDGEFIEELKDNNIKWVGSSNQRVIDVKKTLVENKIILHI